MQCALTVIDPHADGRWGERANDRRAGNRVDSDSQLQGVLTGGPSAGAQLIDRGEMALGYWSPMLSMMVPIKEREALPECGGSGYAMQNRDPLEFSPIN